MTNRTARGSEWSRAYPSHARPDAIPCRSRRRTLAGVLALLAAVTTLALPAAPAGAAPEAGQYVPVPPVTVINNVSLPAGGSTTATVTNIAGVPAAHLVSAVAVNVIANQPAGLGHLQLFAAGATRPVDSTLNYQQGRTTAGFEVVKTSAIGQITILTTAPTKVIVRVRGYYTSAASTVSGARFVPVPPATVVNNLALPAGGTTTFTATGATGANGIPVSRNVKALAVNMIANQPTGSGHLQVYPAGASRPVDSTLNFQQGRTTAAFEVVPVTNAGHISVFTTTATKVIVRVRGYYTISPYTDDGGTFTSVAPATVVSNVSVPAGGITSFRVTGANGIPAPDEVSSVALNVIANQPSGSGHLQVYPAGDRPVDSTLNFQQGRTTAGFEVVGVPADGRISIYSTTATRVIVRLRGWYATAPGPSGADWPQYRNGPARPGANNAETVLTTATLPGLGQAWSAAVGDTRAAPAVVGDVVYAGSFDGRVHALDAATGATRWTATIGGAIRSSPAVVGGVLYIGSGDGKVHALSAASGASRWTVTTGGAVEDAPAIADGVVYAGSADGKVYALDAATGASRWTATTGAAVLGAPAVADGVVYVRSRDGNAYAFDAATGASRWTASIGGRPMFSLGPSPSDPAVANGVLYAAGPHTAKLYALDAATGASRWTADPVQATVGTPAVANGVLYANFGPHLRALDPATGAILWSINGNQFASASSTAPVVVNGVLYHGAAGGVLVARNATTGVAIESDSVDPGRSTSHYHSLVVANGAVYASRASGVTAHHP